MDAYFGFDKIWFEWTSFTDKRSLIAKAGTIVSSQGSWKSALWARDSIEPAILRVPIIIITFSFLWIMNMLLLDRNRLQYHSVLSIKSAPTIFTLVWALILLFLYAFNMTLFPNVLSLGVETGISVFYFFFILILFLPGLPGHETKNSFMKLIKMCIFPVASVSFAEVLLADAFTSLSKVFKDFGVTIIAIFAQLSGVEIVRCHDFGMIFIALLASFPFWIRIRQCSVQLEGANDGYAKTAITLNLIKYATAFPPIWLAAAASLGYFHPSLPAITAVMATVNSLYSFIWDIVMDWGFVSFTRDGRMQLRQRCLWPQLTYFLAFILNFVLRFSWAANRIPGLRVLHASQLVLMVELAEVFRRAVWNLYRIEWEILVQQDRIVK